MKFFNVSKLLFVFALVVLVVLAALLVRLAAMHAQLTTMAAALWTSYKTTSWDASSGRTINAQDSSVTTSEGQGYTLLRAAWENDPRTFAATWQWTVNNLQRPDALFSWRWGRRPDGSYGIMTNAGGQNTASDADTDIAFALLMAGHEWHQPAYTAAARRIIPAIWQQEVVPIRQHYYLAADNIEKTASTPYVVVNPSYLAPYAYRTFAAEDTAHPWGALVGDSFTVIQQASASPLGSTRSVGLPPDWVAVDRQTGGLHQVDASHDTDFGYDAFRTVWRVSLDWQWYHDTPAKQTLDGFSFLQQQWGGRQALAAIYHHDGQVAVAYGSLALYGGTLGYFRTEQPRSAATLVQTKLLPLYNGHSFSRPLDYYDNNWVWFGVSEYSDQLPNLTYEGHA